MKNRYNIGLEKDLSEALCKDLPFIIVSKGKLCAVAIDPEEYNRLTIQDECAKMYKQKAEEEVLDFLEGLNKPE
jgi:PHD/YefM family antitoxin component YafN of YafNO toxin-antitoxin module